MFDHDALVFDNQITRAGIQLPDGTPIWSCAVWDSPISGSGQLPRCPICLPGAMDGTLR
ncbi:MAG: hypothetical protein ACLTER_20055 [Ruminococcus sp.]